MKVEIPAVHRIKEGDSSAYILCFLRITPSISAWVPYSSIVELLELHGQVVEDGKNGNDLLIDEEKRAKIENDLLHVLHSKKAKLKELISLPESAKDLDVPANTKQLKPIIANFLQLNAARSCLKTVKWFRSLFERFQKVCAAQAVMCMFLVVANRFSHKHLGTYTRYISFFVAGICSACFLIRIQLNKEYRKSEACFQKSFQAVGKLSSLQLKENYIEALADEIISIKCKQLEIEKVSVQSSKEAAQEKELLEKLDTLEVNGGFEEAYKHSIQHWGYLERKQYEKSFEFRWRHCRALYSYHSVIIKSNKALGTKVIEEAVEVAKALLEDNPNSYLSHKWYALTFYAFMEPKGTKETIMGGFAFFEHTTKAIELEANDPTLHVMLGKFKYEVAKLSWTERLGAKAIFGKEPPQATFEEALQCFEAAIRCRQESEPKVSERLDIAKCYIKLKRTDEARKALEECVSLGSANSLTVEVVEEARKLLSRM